MDYASGRSGQVGVGKQRDPTRASSSVYKLPQITVLFWVLKIAATTLGETGGDMLSQTLNLGYVAASVLLFSIFLVALVIQLRVRRFEPGLYWLVIAATSTAGTTMADLLTRGPGSGTSTAGGLGYAGGALVLIAGLALVFAVWKGTGLSYDVTKVTTFRGELLYWAAILLSNTLGTTTGDYLADETGLGYWRAAVVISVVMALILAAHYFTRISGVVLFWAAFILTRPLGATVGNYLSKEREKGGLELGTYTVSAILAVVLIAGVVYTYVAIRRAAQPNTRELVQAE
ncbi:COG4705 family protein [Nocardia macrotermitis]|uniref:Membrane-anchored protein n=1 Tax=Nocardia macrotermitis TaxID=2585198 RepID=A0A7K0DAC9_9NOCA|nr:hypothetical protein [Nocardia macrotermitis]MQY22559.1 hypothetical protein [Nocardia macrotermitis]